MNEREAIERACEEFYEWAGALIERRKDDPGDDLISTLIAASHEGDRLDDAECMNLVLNVLVGGVDTTQSQLAHGLRVFAEHPDQWELLAERPELAPAAVEELLRYEPITPFTARLLHEEVEYRGVTFPADTRRDGVLVRGQPRRGGRRRRGVRHHRRPRRRQAAHLRRGHPLLPRGQPRARRASGGAVVPAARACPGWRSTTSPSSARSTASTDWSGCRCDGPRAGASCSPTTGSARRRSGASAEERGFESLFLPEHTHIPVSRETPYPGGGELPREYSHTLDPFVALARGGRDDRAAQGRHGRLPGDRARPDHHGEGGGDARPHLRRPLPVRRRRGLEPGGDAKPRHRPGHALQAHARERRGDEGDLDPGRGRVPRPASSTSTRSGRGRSRCRSRTRRCSWAGSARRCSTAWWRTATSGSRIACRARRSSASGSRSFSGAPRRPAASRIPVTVFGAKPEVRLLERLRAAGVTRSLFYLPPEEPAEVERQLDELAKVPPSGPARRARPEPVALEERLRGAARRRADAAYRAAVGPRRKAAWL